MKRKLLIVGSIGLDTIETPFGKNVEAVGGSAVYASLSASCFVPVKIISVAGVDFPRKYINILKAKNIDTSGIDIKKGKTFRWQGKYTWNLDSAQTIKTQLNLLAEFNPVLTDEDKKSKYVFLANTDPKIQLSIIRNLNKDAFVAADTIEYWIKNKKAELLKVIKSADIFIINEGEARLLTKESNLIKAAKKIINLGSPRVIIKKGEHGLFYVTKKYFFTCPAYPLESPIDPTGAGDTFAGGFLGYIASQGALTDAKLKKALIYGSILASYNVEGFDIKVLSSLNNSKIDRRYNSFVKLTRF